MDVVDAIGDAPLDSACKKLAWDLAKFLVENGKVTVTTKALTLTCENENSEMVEFFFWSGIQLPL